MSASPPSGRWQFSLRSLMLITLWVAGGLGVTRAVPWLGILFVAATLPAVGRTCKFVAQSNARGRPVDTPLLAGMFLRSLGIVVTMTTTSLLVVLGAAAAAALLALVAATSLCRLAAPWLARPYALAAASLRRVVRSTASLVAITCHWLRRFRTRILGWPRIIAASLGVLIGGCCTLGLLALMALISAVQFVTDRFARLRGASRRLLGQAMLGTAHLVAVDRQLLRQFRAP
ncbi:MAG: hypothetical protein WD847_21140 [Pirellulales bacterium]